MVAIDNPQPKQVPESQTAMAQAESLRSEYLTFSHSPTYDNYQSIANTWQGANTPGQDISDTVSKDLIQILPNANMQEDGSITISADTVFSALGNSTALPATVKDLLGVGGNPVVLYPEGLVGATDNADFGESYGSAGVTSGPTGDPDDPIGDPSFLVQTTREPGF